MMDLYGYDLSEAGYLDRCFNETIAYRLAKPLALATIRPADVSELRRIADFLNALADAIEAGDAVEHNARHYRSWDPNWRVGMGDLVVVKPQ